MPDAEHIQWTAELDQIKAELRTRAEILASYMRHLVNCGFTRDEALALVGDYQAAVDNQDNE